MNFLHVRKDTVYIGFDTIYNLTSIGSPRTFLSPADNRGTITLNAKKKKR